MCVCCCVCCVYVYIKYILNKMKQKIENILSWKLQYVTVCHTVYPLVQTSLLTNAHSNQSLVYLKTSDFGYAIYTGFSPGQDQSFTYLGHIHGPRWQPRLGVSAWFLLIIWATSIATDHDYCMAPNPDIALSNRDTRAIPLQLWVSSSASLHNAQTALLLFLSCLPHTCILQWLLVWADH